MPNSLSTSFIDSVCNFRTTISNIQAKLCQPPAYCSQSDVIRWPNNLHLISYKTPSIPFVFGCISRILPSTATLLLLDIFRHWSACWNFDFCEWNNCSWFAWCGGSYKALIFPFELDSNIHRCSGKFRILTAITDPGNSEIFSSFVNNHFYWNLFVSIRNFLLLLWIVNLILNLLSL